MKTTHVIGLFVNLHKSGRISESLAAAGFIPQAVTVGTVDENVFAVNVSVRDQYELDMVLNIFMFYNAKKIHQADHAPASLRNYIRAHSRSQISESMPIRYRAQHHGMDSGAH